MPTAAADTNSPTLYWSYIDGPSSQAAVGDAGLTGTTPDYTFLSGQESGLAFANDHLYGANFNNVTQWSIDGSNRQFLGTGTDTDTYAVTANDQYIYWVNYDDYDDNNPGYGSIGRMKLDGSDVEPNFITGVFAPTALAVSGTYIYWANSGQNADGDGDGTGDPVYGPDSIGRAFLNGSGVNQNFITANVHDPTGLAVTNTRIYWSNFGADEGISEADMLGEAEPNLINLTSDWAEGLAVDGSTMYYDDDNGYNNGGIGEVPLAGGSPQEAISNSGITTGVAVSEPQIDTGTLSAWDTTMPGTAGTTKSLFIANPGQQPLTITTLTYGGQDPSDFTILSNGCEQAIPAGGSCQMTLQFKPQTTGPRSANLVIYSTDYADSPTAVPLSGTGGTPTTPPASGGGSGTGTGTTPVTGSTGTTTTGSSTSTPGTAGSSTPLPQTAPAIPKVASLKLTGGDEVKVSLSCAAGANRCATSTVTETITEKLHNGKVVAISALRGPTKVRTTTRTITIAKGTVTATPGTVRTLTLGLDAAGRKLLAKDHKLSTVLAITVNGKLVKRTTVHLTAPKAKHKPVKRT